MEKILTYLIIYGYVLPIWVMLIWRFYWFYSGLGDGKRYAPFRIKHFGFLIPGVALFGVCVLLLYFTLEFSDWFYKYKNTKS